MASRSVLGTKPMVSKSGGTARSGASSASGTPVVNDRETVQLISHLKENGLHAALSQVCQLDFMHLLLLMSAAEMLLTAFC